MEAVTNDFTFLPNNYMKILLGMSDETKLRVIRMLTDSLLKRERGVAKSDTFTSEMLKKHAGVWTGDETTDEIMSTIRDNSSIRKSLELF